MLPLTEAEQTGLQSNHTADEISQQPVLWQETYDILKKQKEEIDTFLTSLAQRHDHIRVILTGAGSSAFIGDCVAPVLSKACRSSVFHFEAVATTDIVSNPDLYLQAKTPTVMVSFARSGNSPESVASVDLGEQMIEHFYQINITCNHEGHLAVSSRGNDDALLLLLPKASHDKGFAMTSSFTCMMLAVMLVFQYAYLDKLSDQVANLAAEAEEVLANAAEIKKVAQQDFSTIVYLGSGPFTGLSHEAALKMLELTGGRVFASHESSLGFRHGPKSLINDETCIVVIISQDEYTKKYDIDMLRELHDEQARTSLRLIALSETYDENVAALSDVYFYTNAAQTADSHDGWALLPMIVYGQLFSYFKSVQTGLQPDNPAEDGRVNRVVKGATIHPLVSE